MSRLRFCIAISFVLLSIMWSPGQEPAAPRPVVAAVPPEQGRWKIIVTDAKGEKTARTDDRTPKIVEIEIWKSGSRARMVQTISNGATAESWIADDYLLSRYPAFPDIYVTRLNDRATPLDDGMSDFRDAFPGMTWLDPKYLAGTATKDGKLCEHYVNPDDDCEAWIAADSKSPVAYRKGPRVFTYRFLPPENLSMPEPFLGELNKYLKADSQ
ncbi:MAG: hypothetical protein BGO12_14815 [Verrucomicrobia bacterium 61-8]|nr:hypothetical protein [Verrucomicrobiota bacterium]OJV02702.1 MAG: hypothetical protein BGO12_14815 [Verrucomicrobia bacterium 61-8]